MVSFFAFQGVIMDLLGMKRGGKGRRGSRSDYVEDILNMVGKWRLRAMGVVVIIRLGLTFWGSYCISTAMGFTEVKIRWTIDKLGLYQCYPVLLAIPGGDEGD